ncbi:hypothetical protein S3847 [Shigella flexneri 2a str. 2457T]|uniref:Uncharacterized protein n=1 Tax=Shigella flexneri TaxID=623 RepID=A0A0H2VZW8_SHIFL|nr:hypothetical protein S3847 [Shigella flexneri 2a str. 2457T]SVW21437.1 Uncharacterised protein [Klebsiella pneumoniae]
MNIAAVAGSPTGDMIEIGQHLRVRHFCYQTAKQRGDIGKIIRIAFAEVKFRCDSQIPLQRQTATNVADMFMHAKNFLHYNDHWQWAIALLWSGMVSRHVIPL